MDDYHAVITLPGLPPMNRQHKHWAVLGKANKRWRRSAFLAVMQEGVPSKPLARVRVKYTRHSANEPDGDNLCASTKAIQDGICDALKIDDKPSRFQAAWMWTKAPRKEGFVGVEIIGEFQE